MNSIHKNLLKFNSLNGLITISSWQKEFTSYKTEFASHCAYHQKGETKEYSSSNYRERRKKGKQEREKKKVNHWSLEAKA